MSTGAKKAKRPKTIDTFFAPKQSNHLLGVELPRQGVAVLCVTDGHCVGKPAGTDMPEPLGEPLSVQPPQPSGNSTSPRKKLPATALAVGAAEGDSPRATNAGRKRRNRHNSPEPDAAGAVAPTDAPPEPLTAPTADGLGRGQARDLTEGPPKTTTATGAAVVVLAAAGADGPYTSDPSDDQKEGQLQSADAPADDGLTPAQRAQVAANRNRALARRVVSEAAAPGAPPLQLSSLLVEASWREALGRDLTGPNIQQLQAVLQAEWAPGRKAVFPPRECIFQAFNACPFDQVRVVVLGQDPYHGPGQAMGLSFSVPRDVRPLPPSLLNIYKEAVVDLGWTDRPQHGDLSAWSVQGVLLLNTCLTVRQGEANSHSKRGWEQFTDAAIRTLSARRSGVVFLLWGNPAQAKAGLVDARKHHVLKAAHPSPLSASRGFFGCRHFSQANELLKAQGLAPIDWWPA